MVKSTKFSPFRRSTALFLALLTLAGCAPQKAPTAAAQASTHYDLSAETEDALARLSDPQLEKAAVTTSLLTADSTPSLAFDGLASRETMEKLLTLLEKYNVTATFFITGMDAIEDASMVKKIADAGHWVQADTMYGGMHLETSTPQALAEDFASVAAILTSITGRAPTLLKCRSTEYTHEVLTAAAAAGFSHAVEATAVLSYQSFQTYEQAKGYVSRLPAGNMLLVRLAGTLQADEYPAADAAPAKEDGKDAGTREKPALITTDPTDLVNQPAEVRLLDNVTWVLRAMTQYGKQSAFTDSLPISKLSVSKKTKPSASKPRPASIVQNRTALYAQRRAENAGKRNYEVQSVYTTEKAAALTFYGISKAEPLRHALQKMTQLHVTGTFFVTDEDIQNYPDAITSILAGGHTLGAAILPKDGLDYLSVCRQIDAVQQLLEARYGTRAVLAKQVYDTVTEDVREAASAMQVQLVSHSSSFPRTADQNATEPKPIIDAYFKNASYTIKRGSILHFRLDFWKKSDTLPAQLLHIIAGELLQNSAYALDGADGAASAYHIQQAAALIASASYTYPLPKEKMLPEVRGQIYAGHLAGMTEEQKLEYISKRYIGNPDTGTFEQLPGFSEQEIAQLDKAGKIDTGNSNTVFLTFDDWGTDRSINHLLAILEKHQTKATFFIRTNYVHANPNLLRAIGQQGHEIASHTDAHLTLSTPTGQSGVYESLTAAQNEILRADVIKSYQTLAEIVGDMRNERGNPILSKHFRPPTLAISKNGMETIFDAGYSSVVSGDFSTGDYQVESVDALYDLMRNGMNLGWTEQRREIGKGSVIVMHMSNESKHTAEAVDRFLTWNAARPAEERYHFARISDYLG